MGGSRLLLVAAQLAPLLTDPNQGAQLPVASTSNPDSFHS